MWRRPRSLSAKVLNTVDALLVLDMHATWKVQAHGFDMSCIIYVDTIRRFVLIMLIQESKLLIPPAFCKVSRSVARTHGTMGGQCGLPATLVHLCGSIILNVPTRCTLLYKCRCH
eukprot:132969-Amphidinium_carterae.1